MMVHVVTFYYYHDGSHGYISDYSISMVLIVASFIIIIVVLVVTSCYCHDGSHCYVFDYSITMFLWLHLILYYIRVDPYAGSICSMYVL